MLISFFIIDSLENNFSAFFRRIGLEVRAKLNQLPSSRGLKDIHWSAINPATAITETNKLQGTYAQ